MDFRTKLLATLGAIQPVLDEPGVLVAGSEVPNLLELDARSSLIVSDDVDIAIPISRHEQVKHRLKQVHDLEPSREEPSVWLPKKPGMMEVNFIGMDTEQVRPGETFVFDDAELPLLVFAHLAFLRPGTPIIAEGVTIPLPRPAGLMLEKLVTERSGVKGDRDLLVVLGLILVSSASDIAEVIQIYSALPHDRRHAIRSNLTLLSLLEPHANMPDPHVHRQRVNDLFAQLPPPGLT